MKVFKFTSGDLYYAYSGKDVDEAKETLFEEIGDINIDLIQEIPESEWDKKTINVWEDNDFEKEPHKESIRDTLIGEGSYMIYTNDFSTF